MTLHVVVPRHKRKQRATDGAVETAMLEDLVARCLEKKCDTLHLEVIFKESGALQFANVHLRRQETVECIELDHKQVRALDLAIACAQTSGCGGAPYDGSALVRLKDGRTVRVYFASGSLFQHGYQMLMRIYEEN